MRVAKQKIHIATTTTHFCGAILKIKIDGSLFFMQFVDDKQISYRKPDQFIFVWVIAFSDEFRHLFKTAVWTS